jgi:hypothetical protein
MSISRTLALLACTALAIAGASSHTLARQARDPRFLFSCSVFTSSLTEADLRARFGPENVTTGSVPDPNGAEGDRTEGTILFEKDPDARLEISWTDQAGKRRPFRIAQMGSRGRWRTSTGITLGTDLKTVEKLNRRPFRLYGMGFDLQGSVVSWSGGLLEAQSTADCRVGIALRVESPVVDAATVALDRQVSRVLLRSSSRRSGGRV